MEVTYTRGTSKGIRKSTKKLNIFFVLFLLLATGSGCKREAKQEAEIVSPLPLKERSFYLGLVPNPPNSPNAGFEDILQAYEETGKIAEICMVWVKKQGIGELELLKQNKVITGVRVYGLKPFVTLNFAKIERSKGGLKYVIDAPPGIPPNLSSPEFRKTWVEEAKGIAKEFKPEYLSLGNEVNDYFYLHPDDLAPYLSLIRDAYSEIKRASPNTKVLVVLSYNHMVENNQWEMASKISNEVDLLGLTTYPYQKFASPENIPPDYYLRLKRYVNKPIAFTEIGWSSRGKNGEEAQADFLIKFLELTEGIDLEMINWLFLHETALRGILSYISNSDVGTIALKKANGERKKVYDVWLSLKKLKIK